MNQPESTQKQARALTFHTLIEVLKMQWPAQTASCWPTNSLKVGGDTSANDAAQCSIGDLQSARKGSGARYNQGKPEYDLIPLLQLAATLDRTVTRDSGDPVDQAIVALDYLGCWQARRADVHRLYLSAAMDVLDAPYDEAARVFAYGAQKYAPFNWCKGMPWSVPLGCAVRHLLAIIKGQSDDPESGLPHRGHVCCNLIMLQTYADTYRDGDDRAPIGSFTA